MLGWLWCSWVEFVKISLCARMSQMLQNTNTSVCLTIAGQETGRYAEEKQRGTRAQSLAVQVTTQRAKGVSVPPICLQHVPTGLQCACVLVVATIHPSHPVRAQFHPLYLWESCLVLTDRFAALDIRNPQLYIYCHLKTYNLHQFHFGRFDFSFRFGECYSLYQR